MFNNKKNKSGMFLATILGTSIGLAISSQVKSINTRKIIKTAKKAGSNLKDIID